MFYDNVGNASGAAIYAQLSDRVYLRDNIAYDNTAGGMGGGFVYAFSVTNISILNNTIVANTAAARGSGITVWDARPCDIRNNLVAFNTANAGVFAESSSLTADYNDVYGNPDDYYGVNPGPGSISEDPLFVDAEYHDFALILGSPCIDAGDPATQYNDSDGTRSDIGSRLVRAATPAPVGLALASEDANHAINNIPTFVWEYRSSDGLPQYGFECEVGTDTRWDVAEMWASGEQVSAEPSVVYNGLALANGATYYVRVRVNNGTAWGAWRTVKFHMNAVPSVPLLQSPANNAVLSLLYVQLVSGTSTDGDGDALTFDFQLFSDAGLTNMVLERNDVSAAGGKVQIGPLDLTAEGSYWWQVRSFDGYEHSAWSVVRTFSAIGVIEFHVPSQYPNLKSAIAAATNGTRIIVADGVYSGSNNRDLELQGKMIEIISENGPEATIIDCARSGRAVYAHQNETSRTLLQGFTIRNGLTSAGGGLRIQEAALTVRNCVFEANESPHGGAVYVNTPAGDVTFEDCRFIDNNALGDVKDLADGHGGAVYAQYGAGSVQLIDCFLSRNQADQGGAMALGGGLSFVVTGCTLVDNNVDGQGAGISGWNQSSMTRSIVAFNHGGAGIDPGSTSSLQITCSDIFGNEDGDWIDGLSSLLGRDGNISLDPAFCIPQMGMYSLRAYSPCAPYNNSCQMLIGALGTEECEVETPLAIAINLGSEVMDHVVDAQPTVAWTFFDYPAGTQAAYEIQVGTDLDWSTAEMWSTGSVWSSQPSAVYSGLGLTDGATYQARIRVNNGAKWGSWLPFSFRKNSEPSVPTPVSPVDGQPTHIMNTILTANISIDQESDTLTYTFEVYRDPLLTNRLGFWIAKDGQLPTISVGPIAAVETDRNYWWHVRVTDGFEYSAWSEPEEFTTVSRLTLRVPSQYSTIQGAVSAAYAGDHVIIADGVYSGTGNQDIDLLGRNIIVESENGAATTVIDCQGSGRGFYIHNGETIEAEIRGLTVRNGRTSAGGGLRLQGASVRVFDCVFEANDAPHGGAVYANTAGTGSTFTNCSFIGNTALGDLKDKADGHGGAVYAQYGPTRLAFTSCVFVGNSADIGGASTCGSDGSYDLVNCTVVDNHSEDVSSALVFVGSQAQQLTRCIVAYNKGACGVRCESVNHMSVSCTDIYGNEGGDWTNGLEGFENFNNNFSGDPKFCGFFSGSSDFRLRPRSHCLPENNPCGLLIGARGQGTACTDYMCGDANGDEFIAWTDVVYLKNAYFGAGPLPQPWQSGDPDCDGWIKITDILYLVDYLRGTGQAPCCNYGNGSDPKIINPPPPVIPPKDEPLDNRGSSGATLD